MRKNDGVERGGKLFPWLNLGERPRRALAVAVSMCVLLFLCYGVVMTGHIGRQSYAECCKNMNDTLLRYSESSYILNGVDPYDVLNNKVPPPENYIAIHGGGTAPWSMVMNIPFVLPCMGDDVAYASYILSFALCLIAISAVIFRWSAAKTGSKRFAAVLTLAFIAQYGIWATFRVGNQALIPLLVFAALLYTDFIERRRVLGGIALGLSMIKPQTSLLYFVAMLWNRKFIPRICVAVAMVVGAWIAASAFIGKSPFEFYRESAQFLIVEIKTWNLYAGVIYPLCAPLIGESLSLNAGIVFGIALTLLLSYRYRNLPKEYYYCIPTGVMPLYTYSAAQTTTLFYGFIMITIILFLAKNRVGIFSLCVYATAIAVIMIYIPRTGISALFPNYIESLTEAGILRFSELFPYSEDIYRSFMLFAVLVLMNDVSKAMKFADKTKIHEEK